MLHTKSETLRYDTFQIDRLKGRLFYLGYRSECAVALDIKWEDFLKISTCLQEGLGVLVITSNTIWKLLHKSPFDNKISWNHFFQLSIGRPSEIIFGLSFWISLPSHYLNATFVGPSGCKTGFPHYIHPVLVRRGRIHTNCTHTKPTGPCILVEDLNLNTPKDNTILQSAKNAIKRAHHRVLNLWMLSE